MSIGRTRRRARTPEESMDNVARFFENMAAAVDNNDGIFMDSHLNRAEADRIVRICRSQAKVHRTQADELRAHPEDEE